MFLSTLIPNILKFNIDNTPESNKNAHHSDYAKYYVNMYMTVFSTSILKHGCPTQAKIYT